MLVPPPARVSILLACSALAAPAYAAGPLPLLAPAAATTEIEGADQVLTALASVVRTRAQEVAAQSIAFQLQSELCEGKSITFPAGAGQPVPLVLTFGGVSASCQQDASSAACRMDTMFVDTCASVRLGDSLQDPYYLRT